MCFHNPWAAKSLFLLAICAGISVSASQPLEPTWDGRTLSEWIGLSKGPSRAGSGKGYDALLEEEPVPTAQQMQARSAIRGMGTNAIPWLLEWLRTDEFRDAIAGFEALGEMAAPALPELIRWVEDRSPTLRDRAALALGSIGPAASSAAAALGRELNRGNINAATALGKIRVKDAALIKQLTRVLEEEKEAWPRLQVVIALGNIGPASAAATPKLIEMLDEAEAAMQPGTGYFQAALLRQRTVETLGRIGDQRALPVLKRMLQENKNPGNIVNLALRRTLMRALADFGPDAKEALPILVEISANPNIEPRDKVIATEAIIRIRAQVL